MHCSVSAVLSSAAESRDKTDRSVCPLRRATLAPDSVFVVAGAVKRSALHDGDVETVVRKVVNIARHPEYSTREQSHDLALLTVRPLGARLSVCLSVAC